MEPCSVPPLDLYLDIPIPFMLNLLIAKTGEANDKNEGNGTTVHNKVSRKAHFR